MDEGEKRMARVNVETRALAEGRFGKLQADLKMSKMETIGMLVLFWHDSQEQEVWKGPRQLVQDFLPDEERAEEMFNALVKRRYISECPDGEFTIHGNRKHIENLRTAVEAGREGGIASGEVRRRNSIKSSEAKGTLDPSEPNTIQHSSMHDNASQLNASQPSSEQSSFLPPPPGGGSGKKEPNPINGKTWEAYSDAYQARWHEEPVRNCTVNSQIAAMVKRVGADAPGVAAFYVGHQDAFYVRSLHPVGLMLRDCEKLRTEWKRGVQMLGTTARENERREANNSAIDRAFDGLESIGFAFATG